MKSENAADAIVQASNNLIMRAMGDPKHLVETTLTLELAARTLRLGIESNVKSPAQKERLAQLGATLSGFFSEVQGIFEKEIDKLVAKQASNMLEGEEALRKINRQVVGSDVAHPEAYDTGFTDARKFAVESLQFRFDLPRDTMTWDAAIAALSKRTPSP